MAAAHPNRVVIDADFGNKLEGVVGEIYSLIVNHRHGVVVGLSNAHEQAYFVLGVSLDRCEHRVDPQSVELQQ